MSTTSSTSIVTTSTLCWKSTNAAITAQCTKRKRRRDIQPVDQEMVAPSRSDSVTNLIPLKDICYKIELNHLVPTFNRMEMKRIEGLEEDEDDEEVESGLVESERQGRGLLYWATTTDISTSTTYTGTSTLASLMCTPSGFTLSECA